MLRAARKVRDREARAAGSFAGGWAVFVVLAGAPVRGLLFAAAGLYCFYRFFVTWDRTAKAD